MPISIQIEKQLKGNKMVMVLKYFIHIKYYRKYKTASLFILIISVFNSIACGVSYSRVYSSVATTCLDWLIHCGCGCHLSPVSTRAFR